MAGEWTVMDGVINSVTPSVTMGHSIITFSLTVITEWALPTTSAEAGSVIHTGTTIRAGESGAVP